jgi:hypothetical protein
MIRRKTIKTTKNKTKTSGYVIDGKKYQSKSLYDAHVLLKHAQHKGIIESFDLDSGNISKRSRYTSYKPVIDGIKFDSLMEGQYYVHLKERLLKNDIANLTLQPSYTLQEAFTKNGKRFRPIIYIADFKYQDKDANWIIVDVKGKETVEFKLKQKLFEFKYPDLSLSVIQEYEGQWLTLSEIRKLKRDKKKNK